ncbi:DoxX family protein [Haloferax marisrubri]|uniref:DoxX family membrane protein n=1 Tax=Haloferax marisrubri TaxID=1544719 RepID=A0A2P4NMG6_9EURY|nr:DoxX family membrane protein [Haloferax marisrubri]POG54298.1 DoxX family membrane protein [Haloferax marisrubri]
MVLVAERLRRFKTPLRYAMGALYVLAGVMHFVVPNAYAQVVPPVFPAALALVYVSGVAEILLGVGVVFRRTQRIAAWGLIALLVAVFPANVYMATSDIVLEGVPAALREPSDAALWLRLPLQGVLVAWAWWYTRLESDGGVDSSPSR